MSWLGGKLPFRLGASGLVKRTYAVAETVA